MACAERSPLSKERGDLPALLLAAALLPAAPLLGRRGRRAAGLAQQQAGQPERLAAQERRPRAGPAIYASASSSKSEPFEVTISRPLGIRLQEQAGVGVVVSSRGVQPPPSFPATRYNPPP